MTEAKAPQGSALGKSCGVGRDESNPGLDQAGRTLERMCEHAPGCEQPRRSAKPGRSTMTLGGRRRDSSPHLGVYHGPDCRDARGTQRYSLASSTRNLQQGVVTLSCHLRFTGQNSYSCGRFCGRRWTQLARGPTRSALRPMPLLRGWPWDKPSPSVISLHPRARWTDIVHTHRPQCTAPACRPSMT